MSYQVLARKWRPRNFREMVGQEHVLRALINALDNERLHHAYLFTGTRGVGKTTVARIFAKSLNCEEGVSSTPCGVCSTCREIDEGRFVDLIEVDAASRTKVEDTRELLDNVQYAPTRGRYKVYLIDEVHMLSGHSFNALLKTLEEPPPHVKFLLATTDPQKLPVTILSRCLQFSLKRMQIEQIQPHLQHILEQEGIGFEAAALLELARAADGSMRDALSLLDQAIAFGGGGTLQADEVRTMLGSIDRGQVYELLDALARQDGALLLQVIEQLAQQSPDFAGVLAELITALHNIAILQVVAGAEVGDMGEREQLNALAATLSPEDVQLYYQIALTGRRDLPLAPDGRSGLEMVLLRMLAFRPAAAPASVSGGGAAPGKPEAVPQPPPVAQAEAAPSAPPTPAPAQGKAAERSPQVAVPTTETINEAAPEAEDSIELPITLAEMTEAEREESTVLPAAPEQSETAPPAIAQAEPVPAPDGEAGLFPTEDSLLGEGGGETTAPSLALMAGNWAEIVQMLPLNGMTRQFALNCAFQGEEGGLVEVQLGSDKAQLQNDNFQGRLEAALSSYYGKKIRLKVEVVEAVSNETPSQVESRRKAERLQQAQDAIAADPNVRAMIDGFDAQVQMSSIKPID